LFIKSSSSGETKGRRRAIAAIVFVLLVNLFIYFFGGVWGVFASRALCVSALSSTGFGLPARTQSAGKPRCSSDHIIRVAASSFLCFSKPRPEIGLQEERKTFLPSLFLSTAAAAAFCCCCMMNPRREIANSPFTFIVLVECLGSAVNLSYQATLIAGGPTAAVTVINNRYKRGYYVYLVTEKLDLIRKYGLMYLAIDIQKYIYNSSKYNFQQHFIFLRDVHTLF